MSDKPTESDAEQEEVDPEIELILRNQPEPDHSLPPDIPLRRVYSSSMDLDLENPRPTIKIISRPHTPQLRRFTPPPTSQSILESSGLPAPLIRVASSFLVSDALETHLNRPPRFLEEMEPPNPEGMLNCGDVSNIWTCCCPSTLNCDLDNLFENKSGHMTNQQRFAIMMYSLYEAYRTIISSFLVVFVPQSCSPHGRPCTLYENLVPRDDLEICAIAFNSLLAAYFCLLFFMQRKREDIIKQYLVIDRSMPTDRDSLMQMIFHMEPESRKFITKINNLYRFYAQGMLFLVCVNMALSCAVVYKNYLNNNTAVVFITNALCMVSRIYRSLFITSSGEYNIYSAYRQDNLLYNRDRAADWKIQPMV
jgi:hypothetical protein